MGKGGKHHEETYFFISKMCSSSCLFGNDCQCQFSLHILCTPAGSSGRSYETEEMVKQLSQRIAGCFADNRVIDEKETGIYEYGLTVLIYSLVNLATIFLIGGLFDCIPESICYTVCYILLRKCTGGYHARTPHACYLFSTLMFLASILVVRSGLAGIHLLILVAVLAIACSFIVPVDTENKKLSLKEKKVYRFISLTVFLLEVSIGIAAYRVQFRMLYDSVIVAIFCCELLVLVGYLYNYSRERRKPETEL